MMQRLPSALVASLAVVIAAAGAASAQSMAMCEVSPVMASFSPALRGDGPPADGKFGLVGQLRSCNSHGTFPSLNGRLTCATGFVSSATCTQNQHRGTWIVCPPDATQCVAKPGSAPKCAKPRPDHTMQTLSPSYQNYFQGVCVGPSCSGGTGTSTHGIAYSLAFDQATLVKATVTDACDREASSGLGTASFVGAMGWTNF